MKNDLSQKIHGNTIHVFCIFGKVTLLSKKSKMIFSQKNTLKDDISDITKKDDTHPRKDDIGILD